MTDKVQKIKDWISKTQDGLMDAQGNFENPSEEGAFHILTNLDYYIDSLQEELVSEELEESAKNHAVERFRTTRNRELAEKCKWSFITGAKWQKGQMMIRGSQKPLTGCVASHGNIMQPLLVL